MRSKIKLAVVSLLVGVLVYPRVERYLLPVDDTSTIQAFVTAGGGLLTHGSYTVSSPINLTHSLNLNNSTITYTGSTGKIFNMNTDDVKLSNGALVGPGDSTNPSGCSGVVLTDGTDRDTLSHVVIHQFTAYGVLAGNCNNTVILDSKIYDTGYIAAFLVSTATINGGEIGRDTIDRSMISASQGSGITQGGLTIRGASGFPASGWNVHDCRLVMMSNPADWTAEGCEVRYCPYSVFTNVTCVDGSIGISVVRNDYVKIVNCTFTGQNNEAVEYADSNHGKISGSSISSQLQHGILFDGTAGANTDTVYNTTITGCPQYCLHMYTLSTGIFVNACTFTATAAHPMIYLHSSSGLTVYNTNLLGASICNYAFQLDESDGNVSMTGGSATNCTGKLMFFSTASSHTVDNLNFRGVTKTGTVSGYNTFGSISVGSNINFNLAAFTNGFPMLVGGKLYISH